jgi:glucose 1-dehydrogenase
MTSFQDKVAIVTGAGQGIGLAIASKLLAKGAKVVLNDIDDDLLKLSASKISSQPGNCFPIGGDVADPLFNQKMVDVAVKEFGKLDIAIANAGITLYGDFLTYSKKEKDFDKVLDVNMGGTFFLAQSAAKQMIKQGKGGKLLFMSSVTGHQAHVNLAAYGMTKAAIELLTRTLVIELSQYKINVNAVAPGATTTERTLENPNYEKGWSRSTPMGRPAQPEDIANAALFLVSEEANHITGQTLVVDGGWTAISPSPE